MERNEFGADFTWGVASAAWQIEGAWDVDGKSPSIWDRAGHRGRVKGGAVGDVAIDFAHRYGADLDLVADLGFGAKRLSLSWPRIIPNGVGPVEPRGVAFYERILDACIERGIEPWITIYHWDLPQSLHERGGWAHRDSIEWFVEYVVACAEAFGSRVNHWMIANEPSMHALHHLAGFFDSTPSLARFLRVAHHQTMAIAEAARQIRPILGDDAQIGTTHQCMPVYPYVSRNRWEEKARVAWEALLNGMFLGPLGGMGYPWGDAPLADRVLRRVVRDGDEDAMTHQFDFLGVQYYQPMALTPAPIPGLYALPIPRRVPPKGLEPVRTGLGWLVQPEGLYEVLRRYADHPVAKRLVVTENGAAFDDKITYDVDGTARVHDDLRTWYYQTHLAQVARAKAEGVPVDGYFAWSYADNIEWVLGRSPRFGLVYVDYEDDLRRIPKDTALWFRDFLR